MGGVGGALEGDGGDGVADEEQAVLGAVEDQLAEELGRDARWLERLANKRRRRARGGDEEDALLGIEGKASIGGAQAALEESTDGKREEEGEVLLVSLLGCGVVGQRGAELSRLGSVT